MHSAFDGVVVCTPTVRSRADVLALTLAGWRRFGVESLVHLQPDDWPMAGTSIRRNAESALQTALTERPAAQYVIFAEDDIVLSPDLALWIPAIKMLHAPATLFLNGGGHYPREWQRQPQRRGLLPECVFCIRNLAGWYGTLTVMLPRWIAEAVLQWPSDLHGWDIHLGGFLQVHGIPLYATNPNPVQHRGVPTTHRMGAGKERSHTFGLPSDRGGISPPGVVDWLGYGGWDADPAVLYPRLTAQDCHFLSAYSRNSV